jgi:L-ascorbate metabolism protein UlaG (beta-lactamase superfamily)
MEIIYLFHSGFAVSVDKNLLIFDFYQDPSGILPSLLENREKVWVFSSHGHSDHFNPLIDEWQEGITTYFFSEDIRLLAGRKNRNDDKVVYMRPYQTVEQEEIRVTTYGSTDEGVSFLVETAKWRIFHAGDLNWWHWQEDTVENQRLAAEGFHKEIKKLAGINLDVAFFPVDGRLGEYSAIGAREFCRSTATSHFIAMHTCGKVWADRSAFSEENKGLSVWCPVAAGENMTIWRRQADEGTKAGC